MGAVHLRFEELQYSGLYRGLRLYPRRERARQLPAGAKGSRRLSSPSVPALVAHIAAYRDGAPWLDALRDYLQANMRYVADTLNNAFPALCWQPPEATYLAWIDLRPLNVDDRALQQALIAEQKVAIMPGYTYGPEGNGFLRLNVGCPREKLERGVEGLIAALRSLS